MIFIVIYFSTIFIENNDINSDYKIFNFYGNLFDFLSTFLILMSLLENFDIGIDFCHDITDNNI